jgi:hypothetical protein
LQVARSKARAFADALAVTAGARGLKLRHNRDPLPTVAYPKVFVVGCPRSGTTWVADILSRHPRVIGGERESYVYPAVTRSIGSGGRWSITAWARLLYGVERGRQLERTTGLHYYVDRRTLVDLGRRVLAEDRADDEVVADVIRAILDSFFVRSGGTPDDVLVEKTPIHLFYAEQILASPEARLIEVVRDGRDVCVSMQMRAMRVPPWRTQRDRQIELWVRSIRTGLALRADDRLRDRITVVRYEDLKANPEAEIARLYSAAGLDAPSELVTKVAAKTNIDRYPTGAGEFRHRGDVGTYVDHFSAEDDRLFRTMVGDLFAEVGYSY